MEEMARDASVHGPTVKSPALVKFGGLLDEADAEDGDRSAAMADAHGDAHASMRNGSAGLPPAGASKFEGVPDPGAQLLGSPLPLVTRHPPGRWPSDKSPSCCMPLLHIWVVSV